MKFFVINPIYAVGSSLKNETIVLNEKTLEEEKKLIESLDSSLAEALKSALDSATEISRDVYVELNKSTSAPITWEILNSVFDDDDELES